YRGSSERLVARVAQLTSFFVVASCGLLPGPAHESFSVVASCGLLPRTTRPGPRVWTAFWSVAILPLRDTRESWTWSAPISGVQCHPEPAKDPQLVGSSAWAADPWQAHGDTQPAEDPTLAGRCTLARIRLR